MDKIKEIYEYVLNYTKLVYDYCYPYAIDLYNYLYSTVIANAKLFTIIGLVILYLYIKARQHKQLKRKTYKKSRLAKSKKFYNTGFRFEINTKDIIKIKIRLADYCDKTGMHHCYLFNLKLFGIEFIRSKHIDQKGQVYKRKVTFRS